MIPGPLGEATRSLLSALDATAGRPRPASSAGSAVRVPVALPPDAVDPVAWLLSMQTAPRGLFWDLDAGRLFAGVGALRVERIDAPCSTAEVERRFAVAVDELHSEGWLGGVRFAPHRQAASEWAAFGAAWMFLPRIFLVSDGSKVELGAHLDTSWDSVARARALLLATRARSDPSAPSTEDALAGGGHKALAERSGASYEQRVAAALERITAGDLDKVVVAERLDVAEPASPASALSKLVDLERAGTAFWLEPQLGAGFFGLTPERLVERDGERFSVDILAGTAPRVGDAAVDERAGASLSADEKEQREHAFVRRAVVDALEPVARTLDLPAVPTVRRAARVQHLLTHATGTLRAPESLLSALHPTPAVCGTPRDAADVAIAELEPFDRGLYAGAVGRWSSTGESLAVALRCARYDAAGTTVFAGAGIVAGSNPAAERREIARKASALMEALRARREDAA